MPRPCSGSDSVAIVTTSEIDSVEHSDKNAPPFYSKSSHLASIYPVCVDCSQFARMDGRPIKRSKPALRGGNGAWRARVYAAAENSSQKEVSQLRRDGEQKRRVEEVRRRAS